MNPVAYYNEIDPFCCAWLSNLMDAGMIPPGTIDNRSIEDVLPDELTKFSQCHFFAGIGGWSCALRQAGWPDDRPVWTGSCPCQPFSAAGKKEGFIDERHLWPAFFHLIKQCRPITVFGEQVAGRNGETWLDLVQDDLEGENYTVGACVTAACGFGAPHMRKRLYWVADTETSIRRRSGNQEINRRRVEEIRGSSIVERLADSDSDSNRKERNKSKNWEGGRFVQDCRIDGMADSDSNRKERQKQPARQKCETPERSSITDRPGPTNGQWRKADWLFCRDGKWRAVESGSCPLASGIPKRVGMLRGYGNAIVIPQARAFIEAYLKINNTWRI